MEINRKSSSSISLDVSRLLLKYAAVSDIDTSAVCRCIGLDTASLQNLEGRMPSDQFDALWAEVACRADDPELALHFGEAVTQFSGGHILLGVMLNCRTLEEPLGRFCRYHALLSDQTGPELRSEGQHVRFRLKTTLTQASDHPDTVLAMLAVLVRRLTEDRVHPAEVCFTRPQPADVAEYQRVFNVPLRFAQPHADLVFERESLSTAIFLANPILLEALERIARSILERLAPSTTWTHRTGETMTQLLWRGEVPHLRIVAQVLAISPRHLQNKL